MISAAPIGYLAARQMTLSRLIISPGHAIAGWCATRPAARSGAATWRTLGRSVPIRSW
jgi:hypothetical protein